MRTMYDACEAANVPADAAMVAYYIYGNCKWSAADIARFPDAVHVRICTVASLNDGHVLDVEAGDAAPDLAPGWCVRRRAAGQDPSVYCNASTWPEVVAAFAAHGVAAPHYWIAHYGVPGVIPDGAVALQYRDSVAPGYDLSVVADYWPGVDPAPVVSNPTPEAGDVWMYQIADGTIYLMGVGTKVPMLKGADVNVYTANGVKLYMASEFTPEWNAVLMAWPAVA